MIRQLVFSIFMILISTMIYSQSVGFKIGVTQSNINYFWNDTKLEDLKPITKPEYTICTNFTFKKYFEYSMNLTSYTKGVEFPELATWNINTLEFSNTMNFSTMFNNFKFTGFIGFTGSYNRNWFEQRPGSEQIELEIDGIEIRRIELSLPIGCQIGYAFNRLVFFGEFKLRTPITKMADRIQYEENIFISFSNRSKSLSFGVMYYFDDEYAVGSF